MRDPWMGLLEAMIVLGIVGAIANLLSLLALSQPEVSWVSLVLLGVGWVMIGSAATIGIVYWRVKR